MDKYVANTSPRRRMLAGWAAAVCGIVTLGTNPMGLVGAEPHRHRADDQGGERISSVSSEHQWEEGQTLQRLGPTSLHEADSAGLWNGYPHSGCQNCQPSQPIAAACGCDHRGGKSTNPFYRVLDGFAGGIEHAIGLNWRGKLRRKATCDDGCDAGMLEELRQLDVHAVPMVAPYDSVGGAEHPGKDRSAPEAPQSMRSRPVEPQRRPLPAPVLQDSKVDPFADEAAWLPGRNPAIERSAYFE